MRTPSARCTRCSSALGPGWPSRLCQVSALAARNVRFVRDFALCAAYAVLLLIVQDCLWSMGLCSSTHWSCSSCNSAITVLSARLIAVGSDWVSHHSPCRLSSRNDTRLQRRSGQYATLSSLITLFPLRLCTCRCTLPYPCIQTCVFPAHMKSPGVGGRSETNRSISL